MFAHIYTVSFLLECISFLFCLKNYSYPSGHSSLLITNHFHFYLTKTPLFHLHFWKVFSLDTILSWLFFGILKLSFYYLLDSCFWWDIRYHSNHHSSVCDLSFYLRVLWEFFFRFDFYSLPMMCQDVNFLVFVLLWVHRASCIVHWCFKSNLENFCPIFFLFSSFPFLVLI